MTLEEAKAVIYGNVVYACEKAGLSPYTTKLVQDACDIIIAMADRKTEPSGYNLSPVEDEPQADNGIGCSKCESRFWCMDRDMPHAVHCNNYGKDEPQTDFLTFLYNVINPNEMEEYRAMYEAKGIATKGASDDDTRGE